MFLNIELKEKSQKALVDTSDCVMTYGELCDEVENLGKYLKTRSFAFCLCSNKIPSVIGYISMVEHDVVPLMLSSSIDKTFFESLYKEYMPHLVWAPMSFSCISKSWEKLFSYGDYALYQTECEIYELNPLLQLCMSTSGSTGSPKLVRYKKGNLESNAKNVARAFRWTSDERAFVDLGLQYTMGLNVLNTHLYVGATILLCNYNPLESGYWDFMEQNKATNITGVPFTFEIYARLKFFSKKFPYLKTIAEGGGRLTDKRFLELAEYSANSDKRFFATFGTTETSARLAYLDPSLALEKIGSIGKAIPEGRLFLVDESGNELSDGPAEGELCYSGPNVTMGYAISKDDLLLGDVWKGTYRTGDLARRDEDGCYYITGRLSRFLKLLGHRVSLDQCERLILNDLKIECACAGNDETMLIFIENTEAVGRSSTYLSEKLHLNKSLFVEVLIECIPRNESGKILYKELVEIYKRDSLCLEKKQMM